MTQPRLNILRKLTPSKWLFSLP